MRRTSILACGLLALAACGREEAEPGPKKAGPDNPPRVVNDPGFVSGRTASPTEALVDVKCRRGGDKLTLTFSNVQSGRVGAFPVTVSSGGSTSELPGRIEPSPIGGEGGAKVTAEAPLNDPTVAAFVKNGLMEVSLPTGFKAPMRAAPEARDGMNRLLAYCRGDIPTPDPSAPAYVAPPPPS